MKREIKQAAKRAEQLRKTAPERRDVQLVVRGVNKNIPADRIAYICYSVLKHLCSGVDDAEAEKGTADAEPATRGTSQR